MLVTEIESYAVFYQIQMYSNSLDMSAIQQTFQGVTRIQTHKVKSNHKLNIHLNSLMNSPLH